MVYNGPAEDILNAMVNLNISKANFDTEDTVQSGSSSNHSPQGGLMLDSPEDAPSAPHPFHNQAASSQAASSAATTSYNPTPVNGVDRVARADLMRRSTPFTAPSNPRGGFRNSRTWMAPGTKAMTDFVIIRNAMRRLFKESFIALEWKYPDYVTHRQAMLEFEQAQLKAKLEASEAEKAHKAAHPPSEDTIKATRALGASVVQNLHLEGNRSLVLGEPTIFCVDWMSGKEEIAPWPSPEELKWEGDDRAKTFVGRYFPLPREMGAPGLLWGQLQTIPQYPLDSMRAIPTMEDIYLPVDQIDDDVKDSLLPPGLEDHIDAFFSA